ncbi:MAG TPA: PQQ-dependent sugar dehydrogenase [Dehalococcoidia bacterium]
MHLPRPAVLALQIGLAIAAVAGIAAAVAFGVSALRNDDDASNEPELLRDPSVWFTSLPDGYHVDTVVSGLPSPSALTGTADGRIFVTEQFNGVVRVIRDGVVDPDPFYTVPDLYVQASVNFVSELGLVGILADPDTSDGLKLYIYYSAVSPERGRTTKLVRIRERDGHGADPETLLEIEGAPICCHISGSMKWFADGTLLLSVGDHSEPETAQDLSQLKGKLLRLNKDGSTPADNPFVGRAGVDARIWAYGVRNAFGIALDPQGPTGYVLDNGDLGFDKIYALKAGANYGWSGIGVDRPAGSEEPLHTYLESMGLAGAVVYRGPLTRFEGNLLFCQFHRGGALHWYDFARANQIPQDLVVGTGCNTGLSVLPDGFLYYLDYGPGSLIRISNDVAAAPTP